ncbi:hypothetical protein NpNSSI1_00011827 [Neofusicoccum parvum]|uniref:Uncharacterized protein n=2 Tax=Neofusicoccum parvum TaxID=310453 RepID=R1E5I2_BOTPV|nr:hypothetical protein UCRNP2_10339 [Neofusicoccum parvum UCRNP2]GME26980.1 hypothetical protein NpPPO83_00012029 [Neofusicoccum parvum]GME56827.1 hypothetical protein NpNSSI1_00011827 [Neofusicoccum parvum]
MADTLIKNMRDERNAINLQMARLSGDIQHVQQRQGRLGKAIPGVLKEQIKKHQSFSADLKEHETEVWKQLKTDREQIDQLCDDIGEIHGCVGQVARRVDVALVPHHWAGIA